MHNIEGRYYYITPDDFKKALENGISETNVKFRVYNLGWDIDKAITIKVVKKRKFTEEEKRIMEENGLSPLLVSNRLKYGWDIKKAINTPKIRNQEKHKPKRVYSEKLIEKAKNNGICYSTLTDRINQLGWSIEDAATRPINKKTGSKSEYWRKTNNLLYSQI